MKKSLIIGLSFIHFSLWSKVDPPNYNFTLDIFDKIAPQKTTEQLKTAYPKAKLIREEAENQLYKINISHNRYKFPVFVQVNQGKITDFFARLPSYFLHDLFHQSLINRYGKQDHYLLYDEHAVYRWNDKQNKKIIYAGACTITCFPLYIAVVDTTFKDDPKFKAYIDTLAKTFPIKKGP